MDTSWAFKLLLFCDDMPFYLTRMHSSRMRTARSSSCRGGVCLSACLDTHTPGCGPGDTPWPDPSTSLLGVGLETPPGQTPQLPPGCGPGNQQGMLGHHHPLRPDAMHAGIPPAMHAGIPPPPPLDRMTDKCKNITCANFVCGR